MLTANYAGLTDPPVDEDAYFDWPSSPTGGGYEIVVRTGDGRWVGILRLMFHWTMHEGLMTVRSGHERKWCYQTFPLAADALTEWAVRDFAGEPDRWHRSPYDGRRRPDGDASREYVEG